MRYQQQLGIPFVVMCWPLYDVFWWGDKLPRAPLIGRGFRHGIHDCYSLIRDYYGDTVPVGKTGEEQLDIEIEYHQPPDPPEAAIGEPITLTGTQIGVRLKVIVDKVEDLGKQTAVHLKLESTGITIHDDAFREATVTYSDGKTVKVEPKRVKCSNGFDGVVRLDVLRKTHGCLVFPKSGDAEPEQFQMALENVPVTAGGIWNLG